MVGRITHFGPSGKIPLPQKPVRQIGCRRRFCLYSESRTMPILRHADGSGERSARPVIHREDNRDKDSSQIARKSPIVTAGWIHRVSAPVPSEVAIDPRRIHAHIWIPADSQPWIGRFNNDNIFHLILLSCLHTWFSFAKIYLLWYKIQNNIFFHQRDTHSLSPAGLGC